MFTDADYRDYFTAILNADKKMASSLNNIISQLSDRETITVLDGIRQDEINHIKLGQNMLDILGEQEIKTNK